MSQATGGAPIGNKNAKRGTLWRDAVKRALMAEDGKALRECADALVAKAREGDVPALKEIGDRLDGKAHQSTSLESSELTEALTRTLVANFHASGKSD